MNKNVIMKKIDNWAKSHTVGLFVFNLSLILLVLLHSAGYFAPFYPLTTSSIVFVSLVLSIPTLGSRSRVMFIVCVVLMVLAGILKYLNVDAWAERTGIYVFQSLFLGIVLLVFEDTKKHA